MNSNQSRFSLGLCLWLFLAALGAVQAGPVEDFKAANQNYDAGKLAEAIAAYETIEPKTAHVWFNLGNAWFRQNQLGRAILCYERARRIAPHDPDILANLKFAEQRAGVEEINTPSIAWRRLLDEVLYDRTSNQWAASQLLSLWLCVLAVATGIWLPRARTAAWALGCIGAFALLFTAGMLAYRVHLDKATPPAIVVASSTDARFAPLADATVHVTLNEGTMVLIREDRGQWLYVERADGQQGWVKADAVEPVAGS